jgi:hypothetical protein
MKDAKVVITHFNRLDCAIDKAVVKVPYESRLQKAVSRALVTMINHNVVEPGDKFTVTAID